MQLNGQEGEEQIQILALQIQQGGVKLVLNDVANGFVNLSAPNYSSSRLANILSRILPATSRLQDQDWLLLVDSQMTFAWKGAWQTLIRTVDTHRDQ